MEGGADRRMASQGAPHAGVGENKHCRAGATAAAGSHPGAIPFSSRFSLFAFCHRRKVVAGPSQGLRRACDGAGGAQAPRASLAHTRARARVREGCVIAGGFFLSRRKGVITTRDLARRYRHHVAEGRRTAGSSTVARGRPRGGGTRKPFRTSRLERSPV